MKKLQLILVLFCNSTHLFAQNQKEKNDSMCALVQKYFNIKSTDSLYSLAGADFKKELSFEKFKSITDSNLYPLGTMLAKFETYVNGISKYKAVCTNATVALYIGLDDQQKLKTLLFNSYVDQTPKAQKVASNNPLHTPLDIAVDSAVQPYISLAVTHGLSVGILYNNLEYFYGYGETTAGNKQIPGKQTLFEIGSITKTFTAILLADAVNSGKISLNDVVSKYLPDSIPPLSYEGVPVTIKMLSNHSSGISRMPSNFDLYAKDPLNPYKTYGEQQLYSFYKTYKLGRKPGSEYEYSNLAAATLGLILEHLAKKSFEQLITDKICTPLKMNNTRQFIRKNDSLNVATGYNEEGRYNGPWDLDAFAAAGSIRSSAEDMLKYAEANLGKAPAALYKDIQLTHIVTFKDSTNKVALGWHYIKPAKEEILWHNGGTGGYRSYLGINLQKKFAIIILSNTSVGTEEVGNSIIKYLESNFK